MERMRDVFVPVMIFGAISSGCSQDQKPVSAYEFVEWVQVDGSCKEDHATQAGHYTGELVNWRNKTTGASDRYGSVNNWDADSPEAIAAEIHHPNQYHPPFSINFKEITAVDFQSQAFELHGISDDRNPGGGYESTCHLSVVRRLDHLPSDKERKEWTKVAP